MQSGSKKDNLHFRHRFIRAVQHFFDSQSYIEITTPVRINPPALEDYIDAFPADGAWLRTSPELHMKRLLADGLDKIYQIGPCFRMNEFGMRHRTEFTMLEYYQRDSDYKQLLTLTHELMIDLAKSCFNKTQINYQGHEINFEALDVLTVDNAFRQFAGMSVSEALAADRFEELLCNSVEPQLGLECPCFLIDYPAELAALAVLNDDGLAERWELYICGLELVNAYSELCDSNEQRQRFEKTAALRAADAREVYPMDDDFLNALTQLENCAGAALGLDRLLMIFSNSDDIADVIAFSENI